MKNPENLDANELTEVPFIKLAFGVIILLLVAISTKETPFNKY